MKAIRHATEFAGNVAGLHTGVGSVPRPDGVKATGGNWDRGLWPTYFIAADIDTLRDASPYHHHVLIAVNELGGGEDMEAVRRLIANGNQLFIDSGVFWLSNRHAERHKLTMDQALSMAPDQVDGFQALFDKYVTLLREIGDKVWGYIEIDQGGRENKIKTRAKLEALGLRPIPVYHPFNDGWDYFDYLAERYDRICFGNVVQADSATRKRLIATAWERRRKYPHLWIHALGMTASEVTGAYPINSCDSSTWLSGVRWGYLHTWSANRRLWEAGRGFIYEPGSDPESPRGHRKSRRLHGYDAGMAARTMRLIAAEQRDALGCDVGMFAPIKGE